MLPKSFLAGLALCSVLLTSCSQSDAPKTITLGALAPLTGDASSYGIDLQNSAMLAVKDINEAWAAQGMTLELQWENGACNGKDAATATQKLVDVDMLQVILGGFCSSETLAAAPITEAAQVVLFSSGSSSPDVTNAGDYVYRDWPSDSYQGTKLADFAAQNGWKTVAMISEETDYAKGVAGAFTVEFEAKGGTVNEEKFLSEDSDFKTQITKLKATTPDAWFINPQTPVKADVLFKQLKDMGVAGPFLLNDVAGTSNDLLTNYKDFLEGSYTATLYIDEESQGVKDFLANYQATYAKDPVYLGYDLTTYDAVWILAEAVAQVGNDGPAVKEYLDSFAGYEGLSGQIDFDQNGDPLAGHSVYKIVDGVLVKQ
jgi:branched-chain amino acid transport system substrate-binding protein